MTDSNIHCFFNQQYPGTLIENQITTLPPPINLNIHEDNEKDCSTIDTVSNLHNLDINDTITLSILECYNGCIKEYAIKRHCYVNNIVNQSVKNEVVCIDIHKGIFNQETITIPNKGNEFIEVNKNVFTTIKTGQLVITIVLEDKLLVNTLPSAYIYDEMDNYYDFFTKRQNNLVLTKHISLKQALCGFSFTLLHPNKKYYKITSNDDLIVYTGKTQTINGLGFIRNEQYGDLIIHYKVVFPDSIERSTVQQLKTLLS